MMEVKSNLYYFDTVNSDETIVRDCEEFIAKIKANSNNRDYRTFAQDVKQASRLWDRTGGFFKVPLDRFFPSQTHFNLLVEVAKIATSDVNDNPSFSSSQLWDATFDSIAVNGLGGEPTVKVSTTSELYKVLSEASKLTGPQIFYKIASSKKPTYFYSLCRVLFTQGE